MNGPYIDAHAHCGRQDRVPPQDFNDYASCIRGSGIRSVVMFPPVMEIYDRYDFNFKDDGQWVQRRRDANEYLLHLGNAELSVIPYFFIWNDFAIEQLTPAHKGIKWHRHSDEPRYHYDEPRCRAAIDAIRNRNMPVCLEEEWRYTIRFMEELAPDVRIIIPHCGFLNGGYRQFCHHHIWERSNIYTDTALAPTEAISHYISNYGHERIFFGSDFPFGDPRSELQKILRLGLTQNQTDAIVRWNILRVLETVHG